MRRGGKNRPMSTEKVLHLVLDFKWFDLIASGKKRIEYRDDSEFWRKRIEGKEVVTFQRLQ